MECDCFILSFLLGWYKFQSLSNMQYYIFIIYVKIFVALLEKYKINQNPSNHIFKLIFTFSTQFFVITIKEHPAYIYIRTFTGHRHWYQTDIYLNYRTCFNNYYTHSKFVINFYEHPVHIHICIYIIHLQASSFYV